MTGPRAGGRDRGTTRYGCSLREGEIFHTRSAYGRGTGYIGNTYALLDLTALGRREDWEEPKGRARR